MKQFFKNLFSSCLGVFCAILLLFILLISYISYKVTSTTNSMQQVNIESNTILKLNLAENISERSVQDPFSAFPIAGIESANTMGIVDVLKAIALAKKDDKINGLFLELGGINTNLANIEEIRNALIDFKSSKKFIYVYGESISQSAYYLATVADSVWLNPVGILDFKGLSSQVIFLKNALAKLELEPQIIRHGKFKSAIEPLINDKMSDANRLQVQTYLNKLWNHMLDGIAQERNIKKEELQTMVDNGLIANAKAALKYGLIDNLKYKDEVLIILAKKTFEKNIDDIKFISLNSYVKFNKEINYASVLSPKTEGVVSDRIAIVYANGDIESGMGSDEVIGSERLAKAIREARLDNKVKAVVLRINSPGGSSMASDIIWREVLLTKQAKPVVVSMGGVAASGGYYIACAANKIVANPTTITGSIGVFGILLNAKGLLNNKLGINVDTVKTGRFADIGSTTRPLTDRERAIIQQEVETIYDDFITRVSEGRKMQKAEVDSIGQGRVWTAIDAKRIGLIDELGGINKAISIAADLAKVKDYKIYSLPNQEEPYQKIINKLTGKDEVDAQLSSALGDYYPYLKYLRSTIKSQGIRMQMDYNTLFYN